MSSASPRIQLRWLSIVAIALAALSLGSWIAFHHPLAPSVASIAFVSWCVLAYRLPGTAFFTLALLLPLAGLATWSGWIIVDEFDLLALGVVAGRFAAMASAANPSGAHVRVPAAARLLIILFVLSLGVSALIGFISAGIGGGWFAGYLDGLNTLRIGKPFVLALLTAVALRDAALRHGDAVVDRLLTGCTGGLALASLAIVWERAAFVGLLDFSSDYRATALFWEMHVGGAALDAYLALTIPFAWRAWIEARSPVRVALASALVVGAGYACVATFSRAVYVAVPVSLGSLLLFLQRARRSRVAGTGGPLVSAVALATAMVVTAWLAFRHGGYRGLAAVLGVLTVTLALASRVRSVPPSRLLLAGALGALAATVALVLALQVPKGIYFLYGLLLAVAATTVLRCGNASAAVARLAAIAATGALGVAAAGVALYWGDAPAARDALLGVLIVWMAVAGHARAASPLWRDDLRSLSRVVGIAVMLSGVVAVFAGGAYMEERLASTQSDLALRLSHWRQVSRLMQGPDDWIFGKGLGRFPASYFFGADSGEFPGGYRIESDGVARHLVLSGPRHPSGVGDWLRIAQRVPTLVPGFYGVRLEARADRPVVLMVEICEKHLLYAGACAAESVQLEPTFPLWQQVALQLDGRNIVGGPWYAPRLAFLSIFVMSEGQRTEIARVSARRSDGTEMIANRDFAAGMSRWFFTSDREHLPWHAKNIALGVLFDQGVVGLFLFVTLVAGALGRLVFVVGRRPEAPFVAASIVGFMVVGVFDSLLDAPRVAFLFYLLALWGLLAPCSAFAPDAGTRT